MQIKLNAPAGQAISEFMANKKVMASALTKAMRATARNAASAGNERIHGAGFLNRKWELRVINYPSSGVSLKPEAWIHSRVNFEDVFETGKTIIGNPWLWLPLASVPLWPGDPTRQMSPRKFVETFGPVLVTMKRPGKPPMLGQKIKGPPKAQPFGSFASRAKLRTGIGVVKSGTISVIPLFVGISTAVIKKRFDVQEAIKQVYDTTFEPSFNDYLVREIETTGVGAGK